jgi:hypothetical protein
VTNHTDITIRIPHPESRLAVPVGFTILPESTIPAGDGNQPVNLGSCPQVRTNAYKMKEYSPSPRRLARGVTLRLKEGPYRRIVVPLHKEITKGTLRAMIWQADLTVGKFVELL